VTPTELEQLADDIYIRADMLAYRARMLAYEIELYIEWLRKLKRRGEEKDENNT
jgi:hypothetical protein